MMSGMEWRGSYLSWSSKSLQSMRILRGEGPPFSVHFMDIESIQMIYLYHALGLINSFT